MAVVAAVMCARVRARGGAVGSANLRDAESARHAAGDDLPLPAPTNARDNAGGSAILNLIADGV
eukprot:7927526-Pyramimonas_sp.AAC.1